MKKLIDSMKKNLAKFFVFILLYFGTTGIAIAKPYISGKFIDAITYSTQLKNILIIAIFYVVILILGIILGYYLKLQIIELRNSISYQFKSAIIEHYHKIPLLSALEFEAGYIYTRVNQDVDFLVIFLLDNLVSMISNIFVIIIVLYILFQISLKTFLCALFFLPTYLFTYICMKKEYFKRNKKYKEENSVFSSVILEQFTMVKEIKILSDENIMREEMNSKYKKYMKNTLSFFSFSEKFKSIDNVLAVIFQIVTMIIGAIGIINSEMTIGEFMVINSYFSYLLSGVKFYGDLSKNFQEAKVSRSRIQEIMNIEEEQEGEIIVDRIKNIFVSNMSFSYGRRRVINNFSGMFEKNKSYCLIGNNGAGKTTLVNIILGLYGGYEGTVQYNGEELQRLNKEQLRKEHCAYMPQNCKIQDITIGEFFLRYCRNYDIENIVETIKKYEMDLLYNEDFAILEHLGKKCTELSGGQWQKTKLLCSLMTEKEVIILDEPTSAWDEKSKEIFAQIVPKITKEKIVIIISHDDKIAEKCDCKYFIE